MQFYIKRLFSLLILAAFAFQPLLAQQPQKPETESYREGITLFNKGMYEQAAEELQYFIDKHPNNPLTASASFHYIR
ncbi:MAG TPA: hypothetical protein VK106_06500, partial [Balneolaceae bacterium]|nr:hypothetical protein [Balneolaceae bacterium]